jgi:hypothetical protein
MVSPLGASGSSHTSTAIATQAAQPPVPEAPPVAGQSLLAQQSAAAQASAGLHVPGTALEAIQQQVAGGSAALAAGAGNGKPVTLAAYIEASQSDGLVVVIDIATRQFAASTGGTGTNNSHVPLPLCGHCPRCSPPSGQAGGPGPGQSIWQVGGTGTSQSAGLIVVDIKTGQSAAPTGGTGTGKSAGLVVDIETGQSAAPTGDTGTGKSTGATAGIQAGTSAEAPASGATGAGTATQGVKITAAWGSLGSRMYIALLMLAEDGDQHIRQAAQSTLSRLGEVNGQGFRLQSPSDGGGVAQTQANPIQAFLANLPDEEIVKLTYDIGKDYLTAGKLAAGMETGKSAGPEAGTETGKSCKLNEVTQSVREEYSRSAQHNSAAQRLRAVANNSVTFVPLGSMLRSDEQDGSAHTRTAALPSNSTVLKGNAVFPSLVAIFPPANR